MEPGQIVLYAMLGGFLLFNVARFFRNRSVPQVDPAAIPSGSVLLDVRTAGERSQGSIPGSIHIPLQELGARADELKKHRAARIVCYCRSGARSLTAAARLRKLGYQAENLRGGISEWEISR